MPSHRAKRYTIDHEGIQRISALGAIDHATGLRAYWEPGSVVEFLVDLMSQPGFDRDRYCARCEGYDKEMEIQSHQLQLPPKPKRAVINWDRHGYPLPWQSSKPKADVHLQPWHKSRPGHPVELDGCHMCRISYTDEIILPMVTAKEKAELTAAARAARDEVYRLRKAAANENSEALAAYIVRMQGAADSRLREAVGACRDRGIEPWKFAPRREGDDAPCEVVATEWRRENRESS